MPNEKIYIADDDKNIREAIKTFLENDGYVVTSFENGDKLLNAFHEMPCDLIILDIMMPGKDGFQICTEIRKISIVPIIMLTARDADIDYATGLSLGSDDYFTKPFSAISLVMRVKAIFRRIEFEHNNCDKEIGSNLHFGDIDIDEKNIRVLIKDRTVSLTPNEYALLFYLVKNNDRAVSREELLENIWGFHTEVETRAADDTVRRLRKKLSDSIVEITAVWGFGFRVRERDKHE